MFISASSISDVINTIQKEFIYKEVLGKYFPKKEIREEFFQELALYLCENKEKVVDIYNKKYFQYYFITICKNQVKSSSSSWHLNFRKKPYLLIESLPEQQGEISPLFEDSPETIEKDRQHKLNIIDKALSHYQSLDPKFKLQADLFKAHYKDGLSIRQISKKFFNMPPTTIHDNITQTKVMIKWFAKKHYGIDDCQEHN